MALELSRGNRVPSLQPGESTASRTLFTQFKSLETGMGEKGRDHPSVAGTAESPKVPPDEAVMMTMLP